MAYERVDILGVGIDCVDMKGAVDAVDAFIKRGDKAHFIMAANPEKVIAAAEDEKVAAALSNASLVIPDGIGVVYAARYKGKKEIERVPGSELMPELCQLAAEKGYPVFLYGAAEDVNELVEQRLQERYKNIVIAGRQNGYLPTEKMGELIERINETRAVILFLALGSPRQEIWMTEYGAQLQTVKACQGVGGTFDVIAGKVRRAPDLFLRLNLEWLYRLLSDPRRLVRQTALPKFIFRLLVE